MILCEPLPWHLKIREFTGRARLDYDIDREIDFNTSQPDVVTSIVDEAFENGTMHAPTGMDYFAFKAWILGQHTPFALGRIAWDSWLILR